jgi:chromosome segregation ATPase
MRCLLVLLLLAGCASQTQNAADPRDRGFFGGFAAMASGEDERRAQGLEGRAQSAEQQALQQRADAEAAEQRARETAAARRSAEQRYAALDRDITRLRTQLNEARARGAETGSVSRDLDALSRDRAPADPQALRDLERRRDAIARALERI